MAVVASSRGCSLATQCTWRAETAVSPGTTRRSRASSAAARNGERALPPGTVVSTRSCDEAMGAVSRSWSGADAVAKVTGAGGGRRAPPGRRRRGRPGHRGSCQPRRIGCTIWNMIDVTRESTAPVDRLWSTISDVRHWPQWLPTVDAVTPLDPDRPDEVGASYTVEQPGLPTAVWTITAWEEGRSFTWESRPARHPLGRHPHPAAGRRRPHHHRARHRLVGAAGTAGAAGARPQEPRLRHPRGRGPRRHGRRGCAGDDATDDAASA